MYRQETISGNESLELRVVVSVAQIIQLRLLIVHITTVSERIQLAEGVLQRAGSGKKLTPCVVLVFYHGAAVFVNDTHNIALKVVEVEVHRAVELYHCRAGIVVVDEVHFIDGKHIAGIVELIGECFGDRKIPRRGKFAEGWGYTGIGVIGAIREPSTDRGWGRSLIILV